MEDQEAQRPEDQEAQRPEDQVYEEEFPYEPAGGKGWKPLLLIAVLLLGCGALCLIVSIEEEFRGIYELLFILSPIFLLAGVITGCCTRCGITEVSPN